MNKFWQKVKSLPNSAGEFLTEYKWTLIKGAAYAAVALLFYFIFLWFLFPYNDLTTKLCDRIKDKTSIEVSIRKATGAFPIGLKLQDVAVEQKTGNSGTTLLEARDIELTPALFSLLKGWLALKVNARLYHGTLSFQAGSKKTSFYVIGVIKDIYMDKYSMIKSNYGLNMEGTLSAKIDLKGSTNNVTKDSGNGLISMKNVVLKPSKLFGILTLPQVNFGTITLPIFIKDGKLSLQNASQTSKDINSQFDGTVTFTTPLGYSILDLKLKFNPVPELEQQIRKSIPFFTLTRDQSGYFNVSIAGNLTMPRFNQ